jgi:hypothetical protein
MRRFNSNIRVAGPLDSIGDQIAVLQRQLLQCALPGAGGCGVPQFGAVQPAAMQPAAMQPATIQPFQPGPGIAPVAQGGWFPAPVAGGLPFGPNSVANNCAMWPGGPKPLRATYIGGTFPAYAGGATASTTFDITTKSNWFLGFKFMAPDSLMGTGLGLSALVINGMNYLDVITAIPLEVFNALSDNETQGRIDLAWLQTPNGIATVGITPVAGGTSGPTSASLTALQGFALANC